MGKVPSAVAVQIAARARDGPSEHMLGQLLRCSMTAAPCHSTVMSTTAPRTSTCSSLHAPAPSQEQNAVPYGLWTAVEICLSILQLKRLDPRGLFASTRGEPTRSPHPSPQGQAHRQAQRGHAHHSRRELRGGDAGFKAALARQTQNGNLSGQIPRLCLRHRQHLLSVWSPSSPPSLAVRVAWYCLTRSRPLFHPRHPWVWPLCFFPYLQSI